MDKYFSFAKIILLGEYAVLHGADAICLPLKTGQQLGISEATHKHIHWSWSYKDQVLARFSLDCVSLEVQESSKGDPSWAQNLLRIIRKFNPHFLKEKGVVLDFVNFFPPQWGLGASSASISSLCRYAGVNPYEVNKELMGGSGADIACTTARNWFLYRNILPSPPTWELPFLFPHRQNIHFIYSGNKQATASHLSAMSGQEQNETNDWLKANHYVYRLLAGPGLHEMMQIVAEHEDFVSASIRKDKIQTQFPDFDGQLKSLGAWGGDFFMSISHRDEDYVKQYFGQRGYEVLFNWKEMVENEYF